MGSGHQEEGSESSGITPKQVTAGVLGLLLLVFVLQNTDSTSITLLVFDVTFPLWLVLAATIVLSIGIGYLLGSRRRRR
jgi:uncharacterized integral membrane protein